MAPEVGFEPTTNRLTADRSTTELLWIVLSPAERAVIWLRGRDSNPRPSGYEPDELPDCSTPRRRPSIATACVRAAAGGCLVARFQDLFQLLQVTLDAAPDRHRNVGHAVTSRTEPSSTEYTNPRTFFCGMNRLSRMRRIDSRTLSSTSAKPPGLQPGRSPVSLSSSRTNSSSLSAAIPQSVWCRRTICSVPSLRCEMASDRIASSVTIPPAFRIMCA